MFHFQAILHDCFPDIVLAMIDGLPYHFPGNFDRASINFPGIFGGDAQNVAGDIAGVFPGIAAIFPGDFVG